MELIAVFAPLIGFLAAGLMGKQLGERGAQVVTCAGVILAAIASVVLFFDVAIGHNAFVMPLTTWIAAGGFEVSWALRVDQLSVVMMCVVNIVSSCVHVYSVGYMSHDHHKTRFMAYLSLFTFAMLMLVSADNLLQLFFGWEGVGVASYLLIGFWNHKHSANAAAMKAFIVNRVGDFGLALGVMAAFTIFGSVDFATMFADVASHSGDKFHLFGHDFNAITVMALLLFMGAMGKSAQLGLHTWLPDAMEGPTPVSALIHAATMVTAGVFLVARMSPVFEYAPDALMVVAIVGALTAFVAATIGLTQFDIKRVIAYSTMSQLGYMFFALGVSAYGAAIFHLMTHAFFKALLFLGAGSVIHALSDEQDMRKMGGVWREIPVTYGLMWVGSLALAGIPFFAGYYSKDVILESAFADHTWFGYLAFTLGIAAAFMTAFYTWRLLFLTFHGAPRADKKVMEHVHESPRVMLIPLFVLAFGAITAGFVFEQGFVGSAHHEGAAEQEVIAAHAPPARQEPSDAAQAVAEVKEDVEEAKDVVEEDVEGKDHEAWTKEVFWGQSLFVFPENDTVAAAHGVPVWVKLLPLVMGVGGIALAYLAYMKRPNIPAKTVRLFAPIHRLFFYKWYFDELYDFLFVRPAVRLGQILWRKGDQGTIDRLGPDGVAALSKRVAGLLSRFQSGFIYQYAFVMMIAAIAVISWFVFKSQIGS